MGKNEEEKIDLHKELSNATNNEIIDTLRKQAEIQRKTKMSDDEFICKLLDGISDDDNRVIVANTNFLSRINKRYLGPGRFDIIAELSFCTKQMFKDICEKKYHNIDELILQYESDIDFIIKRNIIPLVLINKLIETESFEELLSFLKTVDIEEYKK